MTAMHAFAEPADWIVRFGPEARRHGDAYTGIVALKDLGDGEVEVMGLSERPTLALTRAICRVAADLGFRTVISRRIRDGRERLVTHDLARYRQHEP